MKEHKFIFGLSLVLFVSAIYALGWSTLFTVSAVQITGTKNSMTSSLLIGEKLARVQPRVVGAEFKRFKWIEKAEISRNWLTGKVTITLTERRPIAIYNNRAIDAFGVSFAITNQKVEGLPQIQAGSIESAVAATRFFINLPEEIAENVRLVKVRSGDIYVLEMDLDGVELQVNWGQDEEIALKVKVYKALLALPENTKIRRIDVSAPHAPIVK